MTTLHARQAALILVLGGAMLAACSGGPATTASGSSQAPGNQSATTLPAGTPATAGGPGSGTTIAACTLLSDADIKEITGYTVAKAIPNPPDTIFPSACEWRFDSPAWQVVLGVTSPGGQAEWKRLVPYMQGKSVTGIGDEAFVSEMGGDLMVRRGDSFIDVQYVAVGEPADTQDRLAKRVLEHLP